MDREIAGFCTERLAECDVVALLLGKLYGPCIPGRDISYTEDEFENAVRLGKPVLVFEPGPGARTNTDAARAALEANGLSPETQEQL